MGDLFSAARLLLGLATSVIAVAGNGPHRTAVDNARAALAAAHRRAQERREVDAVFTAIARASRPPLNTTTPTDSAESGVRT